MSKILVGYRVTTPKIAAKFKDGIDFNTWDFSDEVDEEDCVLFTRKWKAVEEYLANAKVMTTLVTIKKLYDDATTEVMDLSHRIRKEYISVENLEKAGIMDQMRALVTADFSVEPSRRKYLHLLMRLHSMPITGRDIADQKEFAKWFDNPYMAYVSQA